MNHDARMDAAEHAGEPTSTCTDWYSEGESKSVVCNGMQVTVRFVGRRGRRGRIVIEAPPGAQFASPSDPDDH
jgi:hypothetical protein